MEVAEQVSGEKPSLKAHKGITMFPQLTDLCVNHTLNPHVTV